MNTLTRQSEGRLLRELALQLAVWHEQGRWHGSVTSAALTRSDSGDAALTEPGESVELSGELCPPELRELAPLSLPTNLAAATEALAKLGQIVDPRRIDVYQLAVLIVTTTTGSTLNDYLCRPLVSAKVPATLRRTLDRALGFSASQRITNCAELLQELAAGLQPPLVSRETPSQGLSLHAGDTDAAKKLRRRPEQIDSSLPFQRLGQYEIVARLGSGGMGDVYQGYDADLDRNVAIKVLPAELARHEDFVARFRVEAAAAAKVEHPHIVPIYTIGSDQGHHFFAMQLVVGESLGQLLERQPQPPLEVTLSILEQVVSGLAAAHRQGLVHRDIKPGNILLTDQGRRALVADFGLAKSIAAETRMTATGVIMGTVDYLSPEQGRGKSVDGRSDLYSIGVLLYQMLAGRLPFEADSPTAMIFQHAYEPPPPLATIVPQVPKELAALVHRLLAKSPDDRYATAEDLLDDLRAIHAGHAPPRLKSASVRQRTAIIVAPKFDDEPALAESEADLAPASSWSFDELYQRAMLWLGRKAPDVVRRWQNTQQQVDGAVFEYQQRCQSLNRLVSEAEDVQRLLAEQLASYEQAAADAQRRSEQATDNSERAEADADCVASQSAAAELRPQIAQQRDELESMRLARAQANAKLACIQIQRDALNARLRVAHARYGLTTVRPRRRIYSLAASVVIAASICIVGFALWRIAFHNAVPTINNVEEKTGSSDAASDSSAWNRLEVEIDAARHSLILPFEPTTMLSHQENSTVFKILFGRKDGSLVEVPVRDGIFMDAPVFAHQISSQSITSIAYNYPSKRLAVAASDGEVAVLKEGVVLRRLKNDYSVSAMAFSTDGSELLVSAGDEVRCWDVIAGKEIDRYGGCPAEGLAWMPDGSAFVAGVGQLDGNRLASIVRLDHGTAILPPGTVRGSGVRCIDVLEGGQKIIGVSNYVYVWSATDGRFLQSFPPEANCAACSLGGGRVLVGGPKNLSLWNIRTGKKIQDLEHDGPIKYVGIAASGETAAAVSGKSVKLYTLPPDPNTGIKARVRANSGITFLAFNPLRFQATVVGLGEVGTLPLDAGPGGWTIASQTELAPASTVDYSPDGAFVLVARPTPDRKGDGYITLCEPRNWPKAGNPRVRRYLGHRGGTVAAFFTRNGVQIVSGGEDNHVRVWETATERELGHVDVGASVRLLAVTSDGQHCLVAGNEVDPQVWDITTKTMLGSLQGHSLAPKAMAIARSKPSRAVTVSGDRTARVWDLETRENIATFEHPTPLSSVAISSDGRWIVSGSDSGVLSFWRIGETAAFGVLYPHQARISAIAISSDNRTVLTAGDDHLVCWCEVPQKAPSKGRTSVPGKD